MMYSHLKERFNFNINFPDTSQSKLFQPLLYHHDVQFNYFNGLFNVPQCERTMFHDLLMGCRFNPMNLFQRTNVRAGEHIFNSLTTCCHDNATALDTVKPRNTDLLQTSSICVLCGRIFRFEKNLLRHLERSHSAVERESLLKCKMCHYTTRHYSNMYVHIRTHTGDKPYYCAACSASFTQGSSLKLHIKSRHHDNMKYFALSKKPRKSNLTKLWSRVYKSDLGQITTLPMIQSFCSTSDPAMLHHSFCQRESNRGHTIDLLHRPRERTTNSLGIKVEKDLGQKKLPYSVQYMID